MNALYALTMNNIITSAGTGAGMDCCLYLVRELYGSNIAHHDKKSKANGDPASPGRDGLSIFRCLFHLQQRIAR